MRRWLGCLLLLQLGTACGDPGARDAHPGGLELEPVVYRPTGLGELVDGGAIDLFSAPQGGQVLVVGARVHGLVSATVEMTARVSFPGAEVPIVESSRTAKLVSVEQRPGWREPDASDLYAFVHLPVCPDPSGRTIAGSGLLLELGVTELYSDFESAGRILTVFPICTALAAPNVSQCECECAEASISTTCGGPG